MPSRTHIGSRYMQYAKLRSEAKYNLAASGIMSYPLKELPVTLEDLEICGPDTVWLRSSGGAAGEAERRHAGLGGDGGGNIDGEPSGDGGDAGAGRRSAGGAADV